MVMKIIKVLLAGLLLLGLTNAQAANAYLGVGIGESFVDQGIFGEMDTAYKIFGGFQFHTNFAVEAAYMDLGQPVEDFFGFRQEYDVWATALWAKGLLPVTKSVELSGKLGMAHWEYDKVSQIGSLPPTTSSESSTDFAWGIGVAFAVNEKLMIPVEYEHISGDIDKAAMFSVSVLYQF
jgi:OOP family OmpA-OmpF porin